MAQRLLESGFAAGFSEIEDGNMERVQAEREIITKNRRDFLGKFGLNERQVFRVRTSHSPNIELIRFDGDRLSRQVFLQAPRISTDFDHYLHGADGLFTLDKSLPICLISGDCVPLLVWDLSSGLHGIVHVGLLGALNGIVFAIERLLRYHEIDIGGIRAFLGPSIVKQDYDVTKSGLWRAILSQVATSPELTGEIQPYYDGTFFDVQGLIVDQLQQIGMAENSIQRFEGSTGATDSRFFSHYRAMRQNEKPKGFMSVIWEPGQ